MLASAVLCSVVALSSMGGCRRAAQPDGASVEDDHEHTGDHAHEGHESLAEIVPLLETHRDTVREAFASNKPEDAHDALHEIEDLCSHLREAGEAAQLNDTQLAELTAAADQLYTAFQEIDEGIHGGETQTTYDDVSSAVDASLAKLKELQAAAQP